MIWRARYYGWSASFAGRHLPAGKLSKVVNEDMFDSLFRLLAKPLPLILQDTVCLFIQMLLILNIYYV